MSLGAENWSQKNDAYLAAALEWLRLSLRRMAASHPADPVAVHEDPPQPAEPRAFGELLFGRKTEARPQHKPSHPAPPPEDFIGAIAAARSRMQEAASMDPPPALHMVAMRFGLSEFESHLLLLCVAMELDSGMGSLCALAQGDPEKHAPTFALALMLFDDAAWDVLSPERPLRFWRLIEINQSNAQPLTSSILRADERIANFMKGLNYVDDRLTALLTVVEPIPGALPPSQEAVAQAILAGPLRPGEPPPVMHLLGPDTGSKLHIAKRVCESLNLTLVRLSADLLPAAPTETETLARLWQRECALLPLALFLDLRDAEKELPAANRFLGRTGRMAFLATREAIPELAPDATTFEVARPTWREQRDTWRQILGPDCDADSNALASQFHLGLKEILRIAGRSKNGTGAPNRDRLWDSCLTAARPRLDTLAQRIEALADWDALVIADPERALLQQIAGQVRGRMRVYEDWGFARTMNRGKGLTALFSGESGTGKTMAAEVIAKDLRLNLYRIDLSAVVSKYIGETEKNLRRVFDAAEDGGAILFFDEADALFGKRSEVKDSHDRYANIEVNYLLQRMEAYTGLAILATNMKSALHAAFIRRLRFIVNFAFPGTSERKRIWEKAFPREVPTERLDFERLSRFSLTGASIHSIALNSAFLAAAAGSNVSMPFVLEAARTDFAKFDKPVNDADFRWAKSKGAAV
jgi:hypothetical protein